MPESDDYVRKSERALVRAKLMLSVALFEDAARTSYIAALSAARAVIFEHTGALPKTHSGVQTEFYRLIESGLGFDRDMAKLLKDGFEWKVQVDYGDDESGAARAGSEAVSRADAFVSRCKSIIQEKRT